MPQVSPKVYFSDSHDSDEHDEWVRGLAAHLDPWAIRPGDHIRQRQEQ